MKLLFCVQRYGDEFAGGAEGACRGLAEGMARRGHQVEVATSCARDYVTWADHYPAGRHVTGDGMVVNRFPVRQPRIPERFGAASGRVFGGPTSLAVERDWLRIQGPDAPGLTDFVRSQAGRFDAVVLYTYLYPSSALVAGVAACRTATVLHPAAHAEPMLGLRVYDELFAHCDGLAFHTPEEQQLVERRFAHRALCGVIGAGIDLVHPGGDGNAFRRRYNIDDGALALFVGRVDVNKGSDELTRFFGEFHRRHGGTLAVVGDRVHDFGDVPGVVSTGFVDEATKHDAYAAAHVFVMPSYLESFSIALCEAWLNARPALVQGHCDVLAGQVRRSGGGLAYRSYAEFDAAMVKLLSDGRLRDRLGRAGHDYVHANYAWPKVLSNYEAFLSEVIDRRRCKIGSMR
jgi:glycosyltransferase involved in cell wall biosynthesis